MSKAMGAMLVALVMTATTGCAASEGDTKGHANWLTDFELARKQATERKLPILADFSGSDWCGWCIKLDKEVFAKKAFQSYAKDNVVLFLADFPSRKKLPAKVTKQNEKLAEVYGVRGFPTVLLLDAKGKILGRTGYQAGGPTAYVKHIEDLLAKAKKAGSKS